MPTNVLSDLNFQNTSKIINLGAPSNDGDAATKLYVDNAIGGLSSKDNVKVATQANINLSAPGASVDGVTLSIGDRVLVRAQTAGADNGIYVFNGAASPLTRSIDADSSQDLINAIVIIDAGTSASTQYRQTANIVTIGVDNQVWSAFGNAVPLASTTTAGIIEIGTQAEIDAGVLADVAVTPATLANSTYAPKRFAQSIGDGTGTNFTINHNFNTYDCQVEIVQSAGTRPTANSVNINFSTAPTVNQYRVLINA
jgi:hypothetical protein